MLLSNDDQRTHFASTLRTLGIGFLVPVVGKALVGGVDLSDANLIALFVLAVLLEVEALSILGGINHE